MNPACSAEIPHVPLTTGVRIRAFRLLIRSSGLTDAGRQWVLPCPIGLTRRAWHCRPVRHNPPYKSGDRGQDNYEENGEPPTFHFAFLFACPSPESNSVSKTCLKATAASGLSIMTRSLSCRLSPEAEKFAAPVRSKRPSIS
jgi:hypothetical protein